jgi:hypothetical protein
VGHTGLVTHDGSEVDGLLGVVLNARSARLDKNTAVNQNRITHLGEGLDLTPVPGGTLAGEEGKRTGSRLLVLVRVSTIHRPQPQP